ncbi:MAG: hypothetical protein ABW133_03960 [Polyangiaceae bacterium]
MRPFKLAVRLALVALPLAVSACGGASFDDPAQIKGLRVIAVQKSKPYPQPGDTVDLKMLFWDGKATEDNPRDLFVRIAPVACENPPGDLYYNCLLQVGDILSGGGGVTDAGADGDTPEGGAPEGGMPMARSSQGGDLQHPGFVPITAANAGPLHRMSLADFSAPQKIERASGAHQANVIEQKISISSEIINKHAAPPTGQKYGLAYVLFTACAGEIRIIPNPGQNKLPFGCFDSSGKQLGADDFVFGYTSMYVYENRVQTNPGLNDLTFEGASIVGSTTDESLVRHVPACKASDRTTCQTFPLKVIVDPATVAEIDDDPNAKTPDGKQLKEQVWVNYYLTAGSFKSSVRLINDATSGFNDKNEGEFTPPAESGPLRLFGVLHDNRGGVNWLEGKIIVD